MGSQRCRPAETLSLQPPHRQALLLGHPAHALRADRLSKPCEQSVQSSVSVARVLPCQTDQLFAQGCVVVGSGFIPVTAAIQVNDLAGAALCHSMLLNGKRNIASEAGKLQPFFRTIAFNTSLSRL